MSNMELICSDPYYDHEYDGVKDYGVELLDILQEFDEEGKVVHTDIGHGADCPAFLIELYSSVDWSLLLNGAGGLFLMGKKINENINGWLEIAEKVKKLINRINPSRIDENAALLLFLRKLSATDDLVDVEVSLQIFDGEHVTWGKRTLDKVSDRIYLITAKFPSKVHVFGITASQRELFNHVYGLGWVDFLED
jgi:hypothetical protein